MAKIWIDPQSEHRYVLEQDRELPEAEQTTFFLRVMSIREFEGRKDAVRYTDDEARQQVRVGTWVMETLRYGLKGWEGPNTPKFETDQYTGYPTLACLSCLHPDIRRELANAIEEVNVPRDEDLKD